MCDVSIMSLLKYIFVELVEFSLYLLVCYAYITHDHNISNYVFRACMEYRISLRVGVLGGNNFKKNILRGDVFIW